MEENYNSQILKLYNGAVYKFLDVDGAIKTLENQTLQFSSPSVFNDPFDCSEQMLYIPRKQEFLAKHYTPEAQKELEKFKTDDEFSEFIRKSINQYGLFKFSCFSKYCDRPESGLLWSHYAQKHEGVCLCFNFWLDYPFLCYEVSYHNTFPKFNIDDESFVRMSYSKSVIWRYEDEIRAQIFSKNREKYEYRQFPVKSLNKVIFGLRASEDTISKIRDILIEKYTISKISIEKMELDTTTFSLKPISFQF
jgi:hypothetical protein